jgi:hypothetical protein
MEVGGMVVTIDDIRMWEKNPVTVAFLREAAEACGDYDNLFAREFHKENDRQAALYRGEANAWAQVLAWADRKVEAVKEEAVGDETATTGLPDHR